MAAMKELICRSHGGTFRVPVKRGRQPVRCKPDNHCTRSYVDDNGVLKGSDERGGVKMGTVAPAFSDSPASVQPSRVERAASAMKNAGTGPYAAKTADTAPAFSSMSNKELQQYAFKHSISLTGITKRSEAIARVSASLAEARRAYNEQLSAAPSPNAQPDWITSALRRLTPLGWHVSCVRGAHEYELTAVRDAELLIMRSQLDGSELTQHYSLFSDNPNENNVPAHGLRFDPDEVPDKELISRIAGCKVTWWNTLSRATETAVIPKTGAKIEHNYDGIGDEAPSDRIVKFVDAAGSGFRAFRLGALLRIG